MKLLSTYRKPDRSGRQRAYGTYECDCGVVFAALVNNVAIGATRSCGCLRRANSSALGKARRTLGSTVDGDVKRTRSSFESMCSRCYTPSNASYKRYGARGVTVHETLNTFPKFFAYMGVRPSPQHTLDRIDPSRGYEPGNLRWATREEQANNRKSTRWIVWNGRRRTATEWAAELGLALSTVCRRNIAGKNPDGSPIN